MRQFEQGIGSGVVIAKINKWGKLWPLALDGEHNGNKIAIGSVADDIGDKAEIVQNRSTNN